MWQTNSNGYNDSHVPFGEAVWISAGIILVLAFGDVLVLLALAAAIVAMTTAWWTYRKAQRGGQRNVAGLASVTQLRPTSTGQRDLKKTSAQAPWRGPSAA
jgi:hypothetical protein